MALGDYRIVPGLVTEEIGQEILVCDTDLAVVHRVSGPAADVLRQVLATGGAPVALESDDITSGLVTAGVLVAADAPADLVSRRSFVSAAAAVGAIGIVTLALPRAAAASSGDSNSDLLAGTDTFTVFVADFGFEYPTRDQSIPRDDRPDYIGVLWNQATEQEGGGPFIFKVTITGPIDNTVVVENLASLPPGTGSYTAIFVPGWTTGETINVAFTTTSLVTQVSGTVASGITRN